MSNLVVPHGPQSLLALELSHVRGGEANKLRYVATHRPHLFPEYFEHWVKQQRGGYTDGKAFMTAALIGHAKAVPARTVKPQKP